MRLLAGLSLYGAAVCLMLAAALPAPQPASASVCGNGLVEPGEPCDSGSVLGSPHCSSGCVSTVFEPEGLPFAPRRSVAAAESSLITPPAIYSPRLICAPFEVRDGARLGGGARVRYRIHVCTDKKGLDVFTDKQVRAAMAASATEFAKAGITLEEESLVHFKEDDCNVSMDTADWENKLAANTPDGVLAVAFVANIFAMGTQFPVGGYCYFQGPICVNSALASTLVVHEMGHFFGLAHTFECAYGKETTATCSDNGDLLCDTPPDRGPYGLKGIGSCDDGSQLDGSCTGTCGAKRCSDGSKPDGYNWMSYYDCTPGRFSAEQEDFMHCMLDHEMQAYNADSKVTTTTTTSTTMPTPLCGDLNEDGNLTARDALATLKAGVGDGGCPLWLCDWNGSGAITAADALAVLKAAVGIAGTPKCPPRP